MVHLEVSSGVSAAYIHVHARKRVAMPARTSIKRLVMWRQTGADFCMRTVYSMALLIRWFKLLRSDSVWYLGAAVQASTESFKSCAETQSYRVCEWVRALVDSTSLTEEKCRRVFCKGGEGQCRNTRVPTMGDVEPLVD